MAKNQINLLPQIKLVDIKTRQLKRITVVLTLSLMALAVITLIITWNKAYGEQKSDIVNYQNSINAYVKEFNAPEHRLSEFATLQKQFQNLGRLAKDRIDGTRTDKFLAGFLRPDQLEAINYYHFSFGDKEDGGTFKVLGILPKPNQARDDYQDELIEGHFRSAYYLAWTDEGIDRENNRLYPSAPNSQIISQYLACNSNDADRQKSCLEVLECRNHQLNSPGFKNCLKEQACLDYSTINNEDQKELFDKCLTKYNLCLEYDLYSQRSNYCLTYWACPGHSNNPYEIDNPANYQSPYFNDCPTYWGCPLINLYQDRYLPANRDERQDERLKNCPVFPWQDLPGDQLKMSVGGRNDFNDPDLEITYTIEGRFNQEIFNKDRHYAVKVWYGCVSTSCDEESLLEISPETQQPAEAEPSTNQNP